MFKRHRLDDATADAVLEGRLSSNDDLAPLIAFTEDVRALRHGPAPKPRGALAEFVNVNFSTDKGDPRVTAGSNVYGPDPQVAGLPKWRKLHMAVAQFIVGLSFAAKAALGVGVAAAAVGGVAATGVVNGPDRSEVTTVATIPDKAQDATQGNTPDGAVPTSLPDGAIAGQENAAESRERAEQFAGDIRTWTECIAANAANAGDLAPEGFDPRAGCEHLVPATTPGGSPFAPGAPEGSGSPNGAPSGTPSGSPTGTPSGSPTGTPSGPPTGVGERGAPGNE